MVAHEGGGAGPWSPPARRRTVPAGEPSTAALGGGSGHSIWWRNTPAAQSAADPMEERVSGSIYGGSSQEVPGYGGGASICTSQWRIRRCSGVVHLDPADRASLMRIRPPLTQIRRRGGRLRRDPAMAAACIPAPACGMAGLDPGTGLRTGSPVGSGTGSLVGSWIFFCFFRSINRDGRSKVPASVNRLSEAGRATASLCHH
jgi:hypothetical protein